jgi:hypothetical protein
VRGLVGVAATLKTAGAFLFLLPDGRPRRRDDEGASAAVGVDFLSLPFGRPGPRLTETPASPGAPVAWSAAEVEGATAALAVRASKVSLLRFPFGRPRFRDAGGNVSGAPSLSFPSVGTLPPLAAEPLRDDMIGLGLERKSSR